MNTTTKEMAALIKAEVIARGAYNRERELHDITTQKLSAALVVLSKHGLLDAYKAECKELGVKFSFEQ